MFIAEKPTRERGEGWGWSFPGLLSSAWIVLKKKENRFEKVQDISPNFFKRVLLSISINWEPVFIEQIKSKADEMLSGWSEVCSYIIGYIYNIYLLF